MQLDSMTNEKFSKLFGHKVRNPNKDLLTQFHMDKIDLFKMSLKKLF